MTRRDRIARRAWDLLGAIGWLLCWAWLCFGRPM